MNTMNTQHAAPLEPNVPVAATFGTAILHSFHGDVRPSHEDDEYDAWFRKQVRLGRLSAAHEALTPNAVVERKLSAAMRYA